MVVLYFNMDDMYFTEAMTYAPTRLGRPPQPQDMDRVFQFRKLVTASLILTWVAMMAVKFSFLALFKRLIDRIHSLTMYWWVVVAFNLAVTGYGASVYVIACPHFSGMKVVTRASGLEWHDKLDVLWEVYFQIVAAEVGLILVSTTAFRALFVSRTNRKQKSPQQSPSLLGKSMRALKRILEPRRWTSKSSKDVSNGQHQCNAKDGFDGKLPNIPGGRMTGMRTFVNDQEMTSQGTTTQGGAELSVIGSYTEASDDTWPLDKNGHQHNCSHCGQPIQNNTV
ncbi:MAG: hypothetical protein LQ338_002935 [Usnochroma carphineum]|nr:MAG: hypothetical protein LQ338_002935 [Usnochroma carphineum]